MIKVAHAAPGPIQLVKGQSTTVPTTYFIGDVAITDQSICDYFVKEGRQEIYLNARRPGSVTLTLWDAQGIKRDVIPIHVTSSDLRAIESAATAAAGPNAQLQFMQQGEEVVVAGEVPSPEALERLQAATAGRAGIRTNVQLGPKAMDGLAAQVERAIQRPGITARRIKNRLVLEGVAYSADAYAHAEKIARIFDPNILNLIEVRDTKRSPGKRPLVQLDVYFMEVKKSALRRFGVHWTPGATPRGGGADGLVSGGDGGLLGGIGDLIGSTIGVVFNLLPKLQFAREKGLARVLEHPSFIVKSGEPAEFFSGTEVPYFSQQNVQFKDVGIKLQAEPIAYGDDIDLKITARLSSLSAGVRQGIDTRMLTTSAYCKGGQSVVLGGLFNNGDAKTFNRIPEGTDTSSALFTLALSRDFQSHHSDFVIFVTPRLVDQPPPAEEKLEEWLRLNEDITHARSKKENAKGLRNRRPATGDRRHSPGDVIALPDTLKPASEAPR